MSLDRQDMVKLLPAIEVIAEPDRPLPPRPVVLRLLMGVVIIVLFGRTFWLQIVKGDELRQAAEQNHIETYVRQAPRGLVYDSHGRQLVSNVASSDIILDFASLPSQDDEASLLEQLPVLLHISPETVRGAIEQARLTRREVPLAKAVPHDLVLALQESDPALPGVRIVSSSVRNYLMSEAMAHVLGYTSLVTPEEWAERPALEPTAVTGKTGLEREYDTLLRGQDGKEYQEVNAVGRPQQHLGDSPPLPGADLTLTIDAELQQFILHLFQELADKNAQAPHTVRGAVVALDPRSGAVRALVSYPAFDANLFSQPALSGQATAFFTRADTPLFNRAIDGTYPPGSTIKPLLAAAGLEEGIITPRTIILSQGGIHVGPWDFPDWKAGGHGPTDITLAIAESVNTFFYTITGGYEQFKGLGAERASEYLGYFGWGSKTGIDLPGEAEGFLPSPRWKQEVKGEAWYIGDTYHLAIGQGDILVTPLQVAVATAAFANSGVRHEPYIVERYTPHSRRPVSHRREDVSLPLESSSIDTVRAGMREAVATGSAQRLAAFPMALAGKTGTAQTSKEDLTHAWFTSFGPYEAPELVLTVLLEEGGEGDDHAVPLAEQIWKWWQERRGA